MIKSLVLNNFFDIANNRAQLLNAMPEFQFVVPLAQAIKRKGCMCGLGKDVADMTAKFNELVLNLNEEQVARFKSVLNVTELNFGIQTPTSFSIKQY